MNTQIDTSFDMRSDAGGKDPDWHSPTLRRYHQLLWCKPLPDGSVLDLVATTPGVYLHHARSSIGEFWLGSDSVMQTFVRWDAMRHITSQLSDDDNTRFMTIAYTIGGMMIFPSNRVANKMTINGARGFHPRIADRFDLTLECIRRHYRGESSPLGSVLHRYSDFFALFGNFNAYVEFFLLDDLVSDDGQVRFFMDFNDFSSSPLPADVAAYQEYRRRSIEFIDARNTRIARSVNHR